MKNVKRLLVSFVCFITASVSAHAQQQDSTGMPGDNFSLQGALEMFKQASSPEEFEKMLNARDKNVNNLDLNGDGQVDYIKVIDKADKDVHAFVLQVAVSENQNQDIAVIELEKTGDTTAVLQIVGDEDIFGEQVIVEASDEGDEIDNNGNTPGNGPAVADAEPYRFIVNVFFWPGVRFVFRPVYVPWVSPWSWRHYPVWWRPWHPLAWHVFYPMCMPYHRHCAIVYTHRVVVAHRLYSPFRATSVIVRTRTTIPRGNYRVRAKREIGNRPRGDRRGRERGRERGRGRRG
jgi:hypothetical protein